MSRQMGWTVGDGGNLGDGWDGWDGWNAGAFSDRGDESGLALALTRTRERLVFGSSPEKIGRPVGWPGARPGNALHALSTDVRLQLATMDLLSKLTVTLETPRKPLPPGTRPTVLIQSMLCVDVHHISAPYEYEFQEALAEVEAKATLRAERSVEIFAQLRFNPAFWATVLPLSPRNTPYTLEVMGAVVSIASFVVQRCKAFLALPRPADLSPRIQPMLPTPPYSTYPGGHATESVLLALVLKRLLGPADPKDPQQQAWLAETDRMLNTLADRIAENRVVAGIHFTTDGKAGRDLAIYLDKVLGAANQPDVVESKPADESNVFSWLWRKAKLEWEPQQ